MNNLDKAIILATEVHAGQVDKGGNPYILHPLRVMCAVEKCNRRLNKVSREDLLCAAVLHDVIEDYNEDDIMDIYDKIESFGDEIYRIVDYLTRADNESWKNYINRIYENDLATLIKIADLKDNCDVERLNRVPTQSDLSSRVHYENAIWFLETGEGKL